MGREKREAQFEAFYHRDLGRLYSVALALMGEREAAADITQEALVRTYVAWRRIRANPSGFAYRTILNLSKNRFRRKAVELKFLPASEETTVGPSPDRMLLQQLLKALSPRQKTVMVLRFYEDLSESEIANLLGVPIGTIKSDVHRSLKRIRTKLSAEDRHE